MFPGGLTTLCPLCPHGLPSPCLPRWAQGRVGVSGRPAPRSPSSLLFFQARLQCRGESHSPGAGPRVAPAPKSPAVSVPLPVVCAGLARQGSARTTWGWRSSSAEYQSWLPRALPLESGAGKSGALA